PLSGDDPSARLDRLEEFEGQAENIGNAARLVGLEGVASACERLMQNFQSLAAQGQPLTEKLSSLVQSWPVMILGYLQYLGDEKNEPQSVETLLTYLADSS